MTDQVVNTQQRSNIVHALLNWTSGILSNYPIDSWNLAAGFIPAANAIKKIPFLSLASFTGFQ